MEILQSKQGSVTILSVQGRLDTLSSRLLEERITALVTQKEHQLLIDFSKLDFISSSGLRVLLATAKQMKVLKGKLALSGMKNKVKEIFDVAGFSMLFSIFTTNEEALSKFF